MDIFMIAIMIMFLVIFGVQMYLDSTYSEYGKIRNSLGLTGAEVARRILDNNGLYNVTIQPIGGKLTDNYNPTTKILSLSEGVYASNSISAIAIAAHECGHAIQDAQDYVFIKTRKALVGITMFSSKMSYFLIMIGMFVLFSTSSGFLLKLGIIFYIVTLIFSVVTLPVEFNASKRADYILQSFGVSGDETKKIRKILIIAAMTYVLNVIVELLQLLRLIYILRSNEDD